MYGHLKDYDSLVAKSVGFCMFWVFRFFLCFCFCCCCCFLSVESECRFLISCN